MVFKEVREMHIFMQTAHSPHANRKALPPGSGVSGAVGLSL